LLGRFSVAAIFCKSGQSNVQGSALNVVSGEFQFGFPPRSNSAVFLFQEQYRLLLNCAGPCREYDGNYRALFPGLDCARLSHGFFALGLLTMPLTIQLLVYPHAYPTHGERRTANGERATVLLLLVARGPGGVSLAHFIARAFYR
jgi:putative oxidoreductase